MGMDMYNTQKNVRGGGLKKQKQETRHAEGKDK